MPIDHIERYGIDEVPEQWWKEAVHVMHMPAACVGPDNKFVYVNPAFEELIGYSNVELKDMTWMDISVQADVGGDYASVQAVLDGTATQYSMHKRYKTKFGQIVPIHLSVWRFPRMVGDNFVCFIVQAKPKPVNHKEFEDAIEELHKKINQLRSDHETDTYRSEEGKKSSMNIFNQIGDSIGGDNKLTEMINNDPRILKWVVGGLVVMVASLTLAFSYFAYYMTRPNPSEPPKSIPTSLPEMDTEAALFTPRNFQEKSSSQTPTLT